jgi:hypothetical protein
MATYSKQFLSESVSGKAVNITTSGTDTTLIHATNTGEMIDEVWLYASNSRDFDITLSVLYGGVNFQNDMLFRGVIEAYAGNVLICPGLIAKPNGESPFEIYATSSIASGINIFGYTNRIN